jgi:hypothetical protein
MHTPRSHRFGGTFLALAALLVGGCSHDPTPVLPDGAVAFTAPTTYLTWWDRTSQCSELSGSMAKVEWYVVPDVATFPTEQGEKVGIRVKSGDRIQIVLAGQYQMHEMVVRHEMLHALLREPGHPEVYFTERCRLTWATWQEDNSGDVDGAATAIALN